VRVLSIPLLIVLGLLLIALLLPSKRNTSVAAWWARTRGQMNFFARIALALACVAGIIWFVLLPLLGVHSIGW
jgi:hypothetical protein